MRRRYTLIALLLIGGHLVTELHTVLYWVNPRYEFFLVEKWFIRSGTTVPNMNILWYTKMVEDMLLLCALFVAGSSQAYSRNYHTYLEWQRYSFRLYSLWALYFFYHLFDMFMFFYDYKRSYSLYATVLVLTSVIASVISFYKVKK